MAYISKEEVQKIRTELKKRFSAKDGWKLSIRTRHSSTVCVSFMESPVNLVDEKLGTSYRINEFHVDRFYAGEAHKVFTDTINIIQNTKSHVDRNAGDMGADYPGWNYHMDIEVGRWDIPFKMSA